jgi:uncharacterized protein (TIGR02594 family)
MKKFILILSLFLYGCYEKPEPVVPEITKDIMTKDISKKNRNVTEVTASEHPFVSIASRYVGFHERRQRRELKEFIGVDPVRIEWCAAFVNAVLAELGISGSDKVSEWPLTARSFLRWGKGVGHPQIGDIVIFPRGEEFWQGHVGFYYGTEYKNGRTYYQILGGNQSDAVTIELFPAWQAISIRRYQPPKSK